MNSIGLKKRIFLPLIAVGVVVFSIGIYFVNHLQQNHKESTVLLESEAIRSHFDSMLDAKAEVMAASLRFIVQNKALREALKTGDRARLLALSAPIYERLHEQNNITHFYFHDAQRINILRVHKPEKYGDKIDRFTAVGAEKGGALFSGIELGPLGTFTLRSVLPVLESGKLIGYLELGQEIDGIVGETRSMFHVELLLLIDKQFLNQKAWEDGMSMLARPYDWNELSRSVLVSHSMPNVPVGLLNAVGENQFSTITIGQDIEIHGQTYWTGIIPLDDAGGRPAATLVMLRDMTPLISQAIHDLLYFTGICAFMSLIIIIFFYFILGQTEETLRVSEERFEKISASAQDAIISMDNDGNVSFWNHAAETILGYSEAEALGKNLHDLIVPQRFHEAHHKAFPAFQKTGEGAAIGKTLELVAMHKDGREFPIELALSGTLIANKWNAIGVLRDITERKKSQREIELALNVQRVLDSILNIALPPLTLKEVLAKSLDTVLSIPAFSLLSQGSVFMVVRGEETLEMVAQRNLPDSLLQSCSVVPFGHCLCGRAAATREIVFVNHLSDEHETRYDGIQPHGHYCIPVMSGRRLLGVLNCYVEAGHVSDESEKKYLKTVADTLAVVIERKQDEEALQQLAHNDTLTGLPNRTLFHDRLEQALAMAQRNQQEFALLFLDLDHFKEINDTLGHDMGDLLLREAATRLLACVRKMDTVARMGGDEFTVILTETKVPENVELVARKILQSLLEPFDLKGTSSKVGCSIGVAIYPTHGRDSETLLKHADVAMYNAKRTRNAFSFFSDDAQGDS